MHIRVFVMLPRHLNSVHWEECFFNGSAPDQTPYGYHFAREMDARVTFSHATPTPGGILGLLDKGLKYLLGFDIRHVWRNRAAVFGQDFDIVWTHTEYEHLGIAALKLLSNRNGIPVLAQSIWLVDEWQSLGSLKKVLYRLLMKQAAIATFHSPDNQAKAQQLGLHEAPQVLQFGISIDSFPLQEPQFRFGTHRPIRILAVGNDRHRDWLTLFNALGQKAEFEVRVASAKWPKELHADNICASAIPQEKMRDAYAWADCVVIPLKPNLHASGLTVMLEAVTSGIPIVAALTGGLETYFDREAIHYVPSGDAEAMRLTISTLARDQAAVLGAAMSAQKQLTKLDLTTRGFARRHVLLSRQTLRRPLRQNWTIPFRKPSMKKVALITGVTGQDGAYLAELLLKKGYEVHGIKRRASSFNTDRIDHLYQDPHVSERNFTLHYGDLTDSSNLIRIIQLVQPDEIYNLGAMSHVAVSFESPEYTADADGMGTLRILEAIRILGLEKKTRFYQASTSELYGLVQETPQKETTPFYPRSPYAVAKLYAYWITVNYREAYGMYACNGILFNHESPLRGETFVTRKITRAIARIALGLQDCLYLGNLSALRDWGHARDYVEMQWLMLQQDKAEDFVIATGVQYSVRQFVEFAAAELGIQLEWSGSDEQETGTVRSVSGKQTKCKVGDVIVKVDPRYYRPTEVETLLGDPSKAKEKLGWTPKTTVKELVAEMVQADFTSAKRDAMVQLAGFQTYDHNE